ncbi:ABC transporter ATP-binding protein [Demequina mangrovi]|uniref:ABC-2 type transport system ATP-binding protein n=1 Tax=Demequina mangrovi TaxID=1043493 RepID=A0A1H6VWD1_9MICO|nr:ABC transporter ATP-binding protein [Demequina mangrovi]SEJ08971.1 ABC-2 type transport system ATP-binding protein [Demequina mangrovi]
MTALEIAGAVRTYGDLRALDGLALTVEPGEIHAIIGLNGAGKTTAMKAIVGQTRLDAGEARVLGAPIDAAGPDVLGRLGSVIDQPFGYPELTVRDNIVHAARLHGLDRAAAACAASSWIARLELEPWAGRRARGLSLGNRQRLGLACAAAHEPDLLILDEPTNALDPAGVLLLRDVILAAATRGAGVLVSSHHLDEVSRIAHRITVIHAGRVVGSLEPGQTDLEHRFFEMVRAWDAAHREDVRTRQEVHA